MTPTTSQADTPVSGEAALVERLRDWLPPGNTFAPGWRDDTYRDMQAAANLIERLNCFQNGNGSTEDSSTPVKGREAIWRLECAVERDTRTQDREGATASEIMADTQGRLDARAGLEKLLSTTPDTPSDNDRRETTVSGAPQADGLSSLRDRAAGASRPSGFNPSRGET